MDFYRDHTKIQNDIQQSKSTSIKNTKAGPHVPHTYHGKHPVMHTIILYNYGISLKLSGKLTMNACHDNKNYKSIGEFWKLLL